MRNLTFKRILRNPLPAVGVVLFTMVMAVVLQSLYHSKEKAWAYYEEIYQEIDVTCTVTNLTGTKSDGLDLPNAVIDYFTGYLEWVSESEIQPLVENVQIKGEHALGGSLTDYTLVGITSPEMAQELWPENGCTIFWNEGFDESVFENREMVCIIPQKLAKDLEEDILQVMLPLGETYKYLSFDPGNFEGTMQVAGIYHGGSEDSIYCSWDLLMTIWGKMGQVESATALHATLRNNEDVEKLREASAEYFEEPDPNADPIGWRYALDIDDSRLQQADLTLRNSLRVNELCTLLVFALSAGAGFLIGFLMIRSRKREINLMRTLGTSDGKVYRSFVAEQMLCVAIGAFIGGITYFWQAPLQLAVFIGIYFVGLSFALVFFLRSNLLTDIKKDD